MQDVKKDASLEDVLAGIPKGGYFHGFIGKGILRRWIRERKALEREVKRLRKENAELSAKQWHIVYEPDKTFQDPRLNAAQPAVPPGFNLLRSLTTCSRCGESHPPFQPCGGTYSLTRPNTNSGSE